MAPIILFVYNRPWHAKNVLESLMQNKLATESQLFIYADGPKKNASENDLLNIKKTRSLIESKKWCKEVIIYKSEINKGLADSVISGITEVINEYEKVIVLEDDLITAEGFLTFMNNALNLYEKEVKVAGISGFSYPAKTKIMDNYFLPIGCSWGWGTWQRSWKNFERDAVKLVRAIEAIGAQKEFNFGHYPFYHMLKSQSENKIDSWAIRFYASFFLKNQLFFFPKHSLIRNIGFDQSGTNTTQLDEFFNTNQIDHVDVQPIDIKMNPLYASSIFKSFESEFKTNMFDKIRNKLRTLRNKC